MFYPSPSPGLATKDPGGGGSSSMNAASAWQRSGGGGGGGGVGGGSGGAGVPPPSPGYGMNGYSYAHSGQHGQHFGNGLMGNGNGSGGGLMHHAGHNVMMSAGGHGMGSHMSGMGMLSHGGRGGGSPPGGRGETSAYWQEQLVRADYCRQASSPHHRARATAMQARMQKNPLPILDPNRPSSALSTSTSAAHRKNQSVATIGTSGSSGANGALIDDAATDGTSSPATSAALPGSTAVVPRLGVGARTNAGSVTTTTGADEQTPWTGIDLGGIRLKTLTASLFAFTNITTLYINHNHLTVLSPGISKLRQLTHLDATGNQLSSVPPELGLLTQLKELLLFDNNLTDLPLELGTLHQLEFLGIEGNPLIDPIRIIMSEKGTQGLIAEFRDSAPMPPDPPARIWEVVDEVEEAETEEERERMEQESFGLLSYNILCPRYATKETYGYTPSWALSWDYRKELIMRDITEHGMDIICLQEVDDDQYHETFLPRLSELGYDGAFNARSRARTMTSDEKKYVDGCATFWKADKYQLIERQVMEFNQLALQKEDMRTDAFFNRVMSKDNIALICLFENKMTDARVVVANAHLYWDQAFRDVKLLQMSMLVEEIENVALRFARFPPKHRAYQPGQVVDSNTPKPSPTYSDGNKIPIILCGDLNSLKHSSVFDLLQGGRISHNHEDFMSHQYGHYTAKGITHRMSLRSAYHTEEDKEGISFTNYTPGFVGTIDHIWYSSNTLGVTSRLGSVDEGYVERVVGFPNPHFPSDHIPVAASFKPKKERLLINGGGHR